MVESVRDVCAASIAAYAQRPRASWVLEWPGQAVLVAAATHWTADLTDAMTSPTPGVLPRPLLVKRETGHAHCTIAVQAMLQAQRFRLHVCEVCAAVQAGWQRWRPSARRS